MIELVDNLIQLAAVLSGFAVSGVFYLKSRRQPRRTRRLLAEERTAVRRPVIPRGQVITVMRPCGLRCWRLPDVS